MSLLRLLLVLPLIAPALSPQGTVWIVDDSPRPGVAFASIDLAIHSSSVVDGDVLLVGPGSYLQWTLVGKALTIQAESPGSVQVLGRSSISGLPADKNVYLRGLTIPGLSVQNCASTVWIEQCTLASPDYTEGGSAGDCLKISSANVVLADDIVSVDAPADCFDAFFYFTRAAHGMSVSGTSTVDAFGCRFEGGDGVKNSDFPGHPCIPSAAGSGVVSMSAGSRLVFSECELVGGLSPGCGADITGCYCHDGGIGLQVTAGEVVVLDSILTGGPPNPCPFDCDVTSQGPGFTGTPQFLAGSALRASTVSPVHENGVFSFHVEGPPEVPVFVRFAGFPMPHTSSAPYRGVELLPLPPSSDWAFFGFTDASGIVDRTIPQGPLPIGRQAAWAFVQFFYLESPTLPGQRHALRYPAVPQSYLLGAGSMMVVLDEAF